MPVVAHPKLVLGQNALGIGRVQAPFIAQTDIFRRHDIQNRAPVGIVLGRWIVNEFYRLHCVTWKAFQKLVDLIT